MHPDLPDERAIMAGATSRPTSPYPSALPPSSRASTPSSARHSRASSRAPSPIRSISQAPRSSRALPSATATVNASGGELTSLTSNERDQIAQKLQVHKTSNSTAQNPDSTQAAPVQASTSSNNMTQPSYRRTQSQRHPRSSESTEPSSRAYTSQQASELQDKERQRLKAAAAAKLAEQETWEKTRGAGSAVLDLLKSKEGSDDLSADSGGEPASRASTPGSGNSNLSNGAGANVNSGSSSTDSSGSGRGRSTVKGRPPQNKTPAVRRNWDAGQVLPTLEDVQGRKSDPLVVSSADKLLTRGISDYTILPKILGRGKFSTVFLASKPHGPIGETQLFAIKHTALFPHHSLIATRLLREPTLLAELPPHPNLVNVYETIRTPGHFYLVEEYLGAYVTLEALLPLRSEQSPPNLPILPTGVANFILDQLLAAVNAIHNPLQICHRDIKPENILVHPDTLQLKLLDFGLATHYSRSEPKLSTCCGSPAFHCPEIVTALRNPLGAVRYWGPEVDAWTCGITMLRLLTGVRYPIGASHSSVRSMSIKSQRAVSTIKDAELRDRVAMLLEINGERRMKNFDELVRSLDQDQQIVQRGIKDFKSTTFVPTTPEHTMNLPLVIGPAAESALVSPLFPSGAGPDGSQRSTPIGSRAASPVRGATMHGVEDMAENNVSPPPSLLLSNPTTQPPQRVLSYIKYCLRSAGILYHCWPDTSSSVSLPPTPGPFEKAFQDFNDADPSSSPRPSDPNDPASSGSDVTPPPNQSSPSTPFPLQASRSERDPYSHIHVFECVLQLVDEPEPVPEQQPTLVQSIFSALSFGRRPANRRSSSMPPEAEGANGTFRPSGAQGVTHGSEAAAVSDNPENVRCLTFYLVLRFPRKPSGIVNFVQSRPAYSRSSSVARHKSRSRASSSAARDGDGLHPPRVSSNDNLALLTKLNSSHAEFATGIHPMKKIMIDSNHTTPRASRTTSPSVAYHALKKKETSLAGSRERRGIVQNDVPVGKNSDLGLTIETSPELLRIAEAQATNPEHTKPRSAPSSRATSRARSRKASRARAASTSHGHHVRGSNKVFVHVSDPRALDAVRKALRIGGTTTDYNPDSETDQEDLTGWMTPALRNKGFDFGQETDVGSTVQLQDKSRRPQIHRRPISVGGTSHEAESEEGTDSRRTSWTETFTNGTKARGSEDGEPFSRGRSPGPAGAHNHTGIPFPANMHRLRAPSNLSFAVVQEESSPSNTEHSASQSKTMLDLQSNSLKPESVSVTTAHPSTSFDLGDTLSRLFDRITQALKARKADLQFFAESEEQLSAIAKYLFEMQEDSKARMVEELDALSFDVVKTLSPLLGLVKDDASPTPIASLARKVLFLLADNASSRELYMAIELRCGDLLKAPADDELQSGSVFWLGVAETVQLMYLLNTVLPRIRTQKPQQFSSLFRLLPQCLARGLKGAASMSVSLSARLATMAIEACCSSILIVVDWETSSTSGGTGVTKKTSREALERFLTGVTTCLPYLAGAETSLSEAFFVAESPRYAVVNGKSSSKERSERASVVKRNESTFAEMSRTLSSLGVDLAAIWSTSLRSLVTPPEEAEAKQLLNALGISGFVLDTHLVFSGYAPDRPTDWSHTEARKQLEAVLPIVLLALAEQSKAATSPELEEGNEDLISDTSLLKLQWCFRALGNEQLLSVDLTASLAQTLATQSVISPSPVARLIRFKLLTDLLVNKSESEPALRILGELAIQSPFSQMQAGAISILRTIAIAAAGSEDNAWSAARPNLIALFDKVFVLPSCITQSDSDEATADLLTQDAQKLTETLSLLYTLTSHQIADVDLQRYQDEYLLPLCNVLDKLKLAELPSEASQAVHLLQLAADRAAGS